MNLTIHHPAGCIMAVIEQKFVICSSSLHKSRHGLAPTKIFCLNNLSKKKKKKRLARPKWSS